MGKAAAVRPTRTRCDFGSVRYGIGIALLRRNPHAIVATTKPRNGARHGFLEGVGSGFVLIQLCPASTMRRRASCSLALGRLLAPTGEVPKADAIARGRANIAPRPCGNYTCAHPVVISSERWPDEVRSGGEIHLSGLRPQGCRYPAALRASEDGDRRSMKYATDRPYADPERCSVEVDQ